MKKKTENNIPVNTKNKDSIDKKHEEIRNIIINTKINTSYTYDSPRLLDEKINFMVENCPCVLDFGKSSRNRFDKFKPGQAQTADINQFEGYPDHFVDICDASTFPDKKYNGIVCNAIIEHVYDPAQAVKNMYNALDDDGYCLCYAPFLYRYHAPADLMFQDYYRYSRDGLAYLFKDFSEVTLYPVRGRTSTGLAFIFGNWKYYIEKRVPILNKIADKIFGGYADPLQTSGYTIWAKK